MKMILFVVNKFCKTLSALMFGLWFQKQVFVLAVRSQRESAYKR